jgi:hypothetical protein
VNIVSDLTLERILHEKFPEWCDSIRAARTEAGFNFTMRDQALWQWIVSGGHLKAQEIAAREVKALGLEEFYRYYICCLYSYYERPDNTFNFDAIKGSPWFGFKCPAASFGPEWQQSIQAGRIEIAKKLNLEYSQNTDTNATVPEVVFSGLSLGQFLAWVQDIEGRNQIAKLALKSVHDLGMEAVNAILWECCFFPPGTKYWTGMSEPFLRQFPQLREWEQLGATCNDHEPLGRSRAYLTHIDWNDGTPPPDDYVVLSPKPGIHFKRETGQRTTLGITWDPLLVTSEEDLSEAAKNLQRHYNNHYRHHDIKNAKGILQALASQKSKGGRPRSGSSEDTLAIECARLHDDEGLTYVQIGEKHGFTLELDTYGKLSGCSKAMKLVRRGRRLMH